MYKEHQSVFLKSLSSNVEMKKKNNSRQPQNDSLITWSDSSSWFVNLLLKTFIFELNFLQKSIIIQCNVL